MRSVRETERTVKGSEPVTKDLMAAPVPALATSALPSLAHATPPGVSQYRCAFGTVDNRLGVNGTGAFIDKKLRPSSLTDRPPG